MYLSILIYAEERSKLFNTRTSIKSHSSDNCNLGILFGDINYSVSVKGSYSYGTLVNIVYVMSATYCVMAIAALAYAVKTDT